MEGYAKRASNAVDAASNFIDFCAKGIPAILASHYIADDKETIILGLQEIVAKERDAITAQLGRNMIFHAGDIVDIRPEHRNLVDRYNDLMSSGNPETVLDSLTPDELKVIGTYQCGDMTTLLDSLDAYLSSSEKDIKNVDHVVSRENRKSDSGEDYARKGVAASPKSGCFTMLIIGFFLLFVTGIRLMSS